MPEMQRWVSALRRVQAAIRDAVVAACEAQAIESLACVAGEEQGGDTIFAIDRISELRLIELLSAEVDELGAMVLVAEGIAGGRTVLPSGASEADAKWRVLVDPIDGTRGLMYQKRPAWVLAGVAPNRGSATKLSDIVLAVQTEIPLVKQHLCDQLWAVRGQGAQAVRFDRVWQRERPLALQPSRATDLLHGFASVSRFFPGARDVLAAIDEEVIQSTLGVAPEGKALCFEDQYISTGGQLYELMAGHDRFIADIRPLMREHLRAAGQPAGLCCHPYDLATVLIAEELGVVVTDASGSAIDAPLNVEADVSWVGYASAALRDHVQPALLAALRRRALLEGASA